METKHFLAAFNQARGSLQFTTRTHTNDSDAIILTLYAVFAAYHCVNRGKVYRPPHKALPAHIVSGSVEVFLYYVGLKCSPVAVFACLTHSVTSLMLVYELPNGHPWITRPSYQAGSFLRVAFIVKAYITQDAMDYHDAMMPLHGFVYTRALLFIFGLMAPSTELKVNINRREAYTLAVSMAAVVSVGHCSSPWAVTVYMATVCLIGVLSRWNSKARNEETLSGPKAALSKILSAIGLHVHQPLERAPEIGKLDADKVGRWIMSLVS